jgi:uncharacterized protein YbbC (DUF1343 family)
MMQLYSCNPYLATLLLLLSALTVRSSTVLLGNNKLRENRYSILQDERVAVLSNPTGIYDDTLIHVVDDMHGVKNLTLLAIFSPEHG